MTRRVLILNLDTSVPQPPRLTPLILLPLADGRAAVALGDFSAEEALAELLASGVPVQSSKVVEE